MGRTHEGSSNVICGFGREVEQVSARSIFLLKDIDSTISSLKRLTAQLDADMQYAEGLAVGIQTVAVEIDTDSTISVQLEKSQSTVCDLYQELISRRESGRVDDRLSDEDGIEDAYTEAIAAASDLHNSLNDLRWAINEHDADLSETGKPFTNAEDLIKHLAA